METKVQFNVLESIENMYKFSEDSQLRPALFETLGDDLKHLSRYLQVNEMQALLFANAFIVSFEHSRMSNVFSHFGFPDYKMVFYLQDIEVLFKKKLLLKERHFDAQRMDYLIDRKISHAITKNLNPDLIKTELTDLSQVLEEFDKYSEMYDNESITKPELDRYLFSLTDEYPNIEFFKKLDQWSLPPYEKFFLLDTIWDAISCGDNNYNTMVQKTLDDYFPSRTASISVINRLVEGNSNLIKYNLIDVLKNNYRNRIKARLSKSLVNLLKETEKLEIDFFEEENKRLIQSKSIKKKELFYNEAEISAIETLKSTLVESKFKQLQKRLDKKAMPLGITILLHGKPGTGKTESVYQLAKESGRNIFKVDISQTKSMWFGESQKLVKKIFTEYQEFKETEKKCPILLFNEADAIIGKRKEAGSSNVSDTENAIQNILLEELENFNGILFATTNLVENLDAAFERRFLYKIHFEKPSSQVAAKIWKSKLPFLSEEEAFELASKFDFSGGEMENIARKILMDEVLNNISPCFDGVMNYCKNENWTNGSVSKIGF
ncbi:MAG: ATP-binding protein [Flavobacteriia bacterium]|nr:ATP-binding protein [Flavobacteriia bacterium]